MYVIDMFIYKYGHQVFYFIGTLCSFLVECHDILEQDSEGVSKFLLTNT